MVTKKSLKEILYSIKDSIISVCMKMVYDLNTIFASILSAPALHFFVIIHNILHTIIKLQSNTE